MIAIVVVEGAPGEARVVAGLPVPLRALLALQAAGADALGFAGEHALAWATLACADDRVKRAVEPYDAPPAEAHLCVSGRLVIDARSARALAANEGALFEGAEVVAVHRGAGHGGAFLDAAGALDGAGFGVRVVVRDGASARRAEDALFEGLRKPQDGVVSRALNRAISLRVTRVLCRTGLRPNELSVGILSFGVAAAALAARGDYRSMAVAGLCFQAQSVLDGCDGELARLTFRGSRLGEWIDTVGDDCTNYGFFAGAAWGLSRAGFGDAALVAGALGLGAGLLASGIEYRYLLRIGSGDLLKYPLGFGNDAGPRAEPDRGVARVAGLLRPLFKRDFFVFATMLATFAGARATFAMLVLFAAGAWITLVAVLRSEWARRGVAPGRERT